MICNEFFGSCSIDREVLVDTESVSLRLCHRLLALVLLEGGQCAPRAQLDATVVSGLAVLTVNHVKHKGAI